MGSNIDQRHIETARLQLEEPQNPDDVDTDRSLTPVRSHAISAPDLHEPEDVPEESPWRLNTLGVALLTALICCLLVIAGLKIKLNQAHAALDEAEGAAESAESAVAREPADEPEPLHAPYAAKPAQAPEPDLIPAPPLVAARAPIAAPPSIDAPPKRDQLVLLLTVGTEHYAQKQVRALKHKCTAPLAVYRQRKGRCAYSQCFAIAVPIEDAESASGCGRVRGQSVRDRADFVLP